MQTMSGVLVIALMSGCVGQFGSGSDHDDKRRAAEQLFAGNTDVGDPCEENGWYGDGECDAFCPDIDSDCLGGDALAREPTGSPTRYPIVLAHGFSASRSIFHFRGVAAALRADGHRVYEAEVPPFQSSEVRALRLAREVDAALALYGAERVNIIAHSQGGLDARYLVSQLGYADRVGSITTISTPHRGTLVADIALQLSPGVAGDAFSALAGFFGSLLSQNADSNDLRAALHTLSERNASAFNAATPDAPGVLYQSWAGSSNVFGIGNPLDDIACEGLGQRRRGRNDVMHPLLVPIAAFVAHGLALRPNDGMVTVESAKWGEFRGCIPADHADEINYLRRDGADWITGFDPVRFYREVSFDLAAQGH